MRIERALGPPIHDRIGVQKHPGRGQEVIIAAHLAGRYFRAAEVFPVPLRARQNEAHLLHPRVAVDDDHDLRPVDREAARSDRGPAPGDPLLLASGAVDDQMRNFVDEGPAQPRQLGRNVDRGCGLGRAGDRPRPGWDWRQSRLSIHLWASRSPVRKLRMRIARSGRMSTMIRMRVPPWFDRVGRARCGRPISEFSRRHCWGSGRSRSRA